SEEEKKGLYTPEVRLATREYSTPQHLQRTFAALASHDPLNRVLEAEFRTILPDQVMTFVDRLSMAHSLEVRTAFLDTAVVQFVGRLPGRLKINAGETKYLLKQAARRYLPERMIFRPKEGFVMPVNNWLLHELRPYVTQALSTERLARHGILEPAAVTNVVAR